MASHVRWYVNISKWTPKRDEWLKLTSCINRDEVDRINRYVFRDDSKASLIGCALIRSFLSQTVGRPSNEFSLTRTELGRPQVYRDFKDPKVLDFNVSHSGDYCVLAGVWSNLDNIEIRVGVDVTKIVEKKTKPELDRFLDLMSRREFLPSEWETVVKATDDRQKCINFTRLWCLKESFIKSIGLGLTFKLNRIVFEPESRWNYDCSSGRMLFGTEVLLDGQLAKSWQFVETALDNKHLVAVGYNLSLDSLEPDKCPFVEVTIDSLLDSLSPIVTDPNEDDWTKFLARQNKTN